MKNMDMNSGTEAKTVSPEKTDQAENFELKNKAEDYFKFGEIGQYFLRIFGKKVPGKPKSFSLSIMHGINRISVIMFLLALLFFIGKKIF